MGFEIFDLHSRPSSQVRCRSCGLCSEVFNGGTGTTLTTESYQPSYELHLYLHERQHCDLLAFDYLFEGRTGPRDDVRLQRIAPLNGLRVAVHLQGYILRRNSQ